MVIRMRLIDADALIEKLVAEKSVMNRRIESRSNASNYDFSERIDAFKTDIAYIDYFIARLDGAPAVNAEPARHRRWILGDGGTDATD